VLRKIINSYIEKSFQEKISTWEDRNISNVVDILNIDYDSNENIRRYINAILQSFFSVSEDNMKGRRVVVIDEAHLLLGENSNTTKLLSRLLRESRKLGLSLIFITQNENDVSPEIRSQFQNKFLFREENNDLLIHLPDQTCSAKLFNGKLSFLMKVDPILRSGEN
jgi:DNA helicase HerA-like ATPase